MPIFHMKRHASTSVSRQPMFRSAQSRGWAEDRTPFFQPAAVPVLQRSAVQEPTIQRQPAQTGAEEEKKEPLTEGLKTVGEKLLDKPEFKAWYKPQLNILKQQLWEQQPSEVKAALLGFGGLNLALGGLAFGLNPELRKMLSDVNIGKPLGWIPYSPVEGFKYKLPEAGKSAYGFSADFTLNPYLELLREKYPHMPLSGLTFGLDTSYDPTDKGLSLTGGKFGMEFLGGGLKAEGKSFSELSHYPMWLPGARPGEPPSTLMQSVPGLPPMKTGPGFQVMVTADMLKLFPGLARLF